MKEFIAIGNITNDLPDNPSGEPRVGGGVTYAAIAARRLGMESKIITKAPANHPYLGQISLLGVDITRLETFSEDKVDHITTFRNTYDDDGNRTQHVSEAQEMIGKNDLPNFPKVGKDPIFFVSPVLDDVDPNIFVNLAQKGNLVITPQGYFRKVQGNGEVTRTPWKQIDLLSHAELVVLSDEDITFNAGLDKEYLERIITACRIVVLTRGKNGLSVYKDGDKTLDIDAFPISNQEIISPTGAGDSCAAAFTWHYYKNRDLLTAGVFASMYPAFKLIGVGGNKRGVEALPTIEQVKTYMGKDQVRVNTYLKANNVLDLKI